ncbi:MAG: hypothetical protein OXH45_04920 [Gammaproteobacteria bacterium]|nr:hypothetical protein [Gammaproteobacteria bacterium]
MKKYLTVFAALAVAGCAYSGYRTTYLEEYAGYDCVELRTERLVVEAELGPKWVKGRSTGNTMSKALFFSDNVPPVPAAVADRMTPTIFDYPGATGNQKERMQMHARWQALLELERNRGCAQAS